MEQLEGVQVCDVLRRDVCAQKEQLHAILPQFLHQERVPRICRIFHTKHANQVQILRQLEQEGVVPIVHALR